MKILEIIFILTLSILAIPITFNFIRSGSLKSFLTMIGLMFVTIIIAILFKYLQT